MINTLIAADSAISLTLGALAHRAATYKQRRAARFDPLTGLRTRGAWDRAAQRHADYHPHSIVLLLDLNKFKPVNDAHGHDAGDIILTEQARRLTAWCAPRDGIPGRLGGDEFVAVAKQISTYIGDDLDALTDLLAAPIAVGERTDPDGQPLPPVDVACPASIGAMTYSAIPAPTRSLAVAKRAVDAAMYDAKTLGHPWQIAEPLRPSDIPHRPVQRIRHHGLVTEGVAAR